MDSRRPSGNEEKHEAATKIQAVFRGYLQRKNYADSISVSNEMKWQHEPILHTDDSASLLHLFEKALQNKPPYQKRRITSSYLANAIDARAYQCVKKLLEWNEELNCADLIKRLIVNTVKNYDPSMMLILNQGNFEATVIEFFPDTLFDGSDFNENLQSHLITLLRFTPIDTVNKLVALFIEKNKLKGPILKECYEKVREDFLKYAPFFSRYSNQFDLGPLAGLYSKENFSALKKFAMKDMEYGKRRRALADKLLSDLSQSATSYVPEDKAFLSLPPSSTGNRRAAALLEAISTWNSNELKNDLFRKLRIEARACGRTFITDRYKWALPLIKVVFKHSRSNNIAKNFLNGDPVEFCYSLTNERNVALSNVTAIESMSDQYRMWLHGLADLCKEWPTIEDTFERAWSIDLTYPSETSEKNMNQYQKNLTKFYETIAELVSYIGKNQPLARGSGTYAEFMLAILHLHHGLQPPILKLIFPQLDVLDITFPTSDYKYFFPHFFEPSTIPKHLHFRDISPSLPAADQVMQLYSQLHAEPKLARKILSSTEVQAASITDIKAPPVKKEGSEHNDADQRSQNFFGRGRP